MVKIGSHSAQRQHVASDSSTSKVQDIDLQRRATKAIVRRRLLDCSQPSDPNQIPVLILLAHDIVEQVTDYFTLIRLSRTCKALYQVIQKRSDIRHKLFDSLEVEQNGDPLYAQNPGKPICDYIRCERNRSYYWRQGRYDHSQRKQLDQQLEKVPLIKDGGLNFADVLENAALPCYRCRQIKGRSQFFQHYAQHHLTLLGCEAHLRACIDCVFACYPAPGQPGLDDFEESIHTPLNRATYLIVGDRHVYLRDMPKGYPGFRQICRICHVVRWIRTRPRKTRVVARVCEDCFLQNLHVSRGSISSRSPPLQSNADGNDDGDEEEGEEVEDRETFEGVEFEIHMPNSMQKPGRSRFDILSDDEG